jgi:glutathione peroxidase
MLTAFDSFLPVFRRGFCRIISKQINNLGVKMKIYPRFLIMFLICLLLPAALAPAETFTNRACSEILNNKVKDIDGNEINLCDYQGKVLMFVNVATKCSFTEQYDDLEALYQKYKDRDFVILAFPANDFKNQEPGTEAQIKKFATSKYGVSFPMFSKIHVIGPQQAPLYQKLTAASGRGVEWNFQKFLVGRKGEFVRSFEPKTKPLSIEIESAVQHELDKVSASLN